MTTKGFVYVIYDLTTDCKNVYIGSTSETLQKREGRHKSQYKNWKLGMDCYRSVFKLLENNNYKMYKLEEIEYTHLDELLKLEQYYYELYKCKPYKNVMNNIQPYDYRKTHKFDCLCGATIKCKLSSSKFFNHLNTKSHKEKISKVF